MTPPYQIVGSKLVVLAIEDVYENIQHKVLPLEVYCRNPEVHILRG